MVKRFQRGKVCWGLIALKAYRPILLYVPCCCLHWSWLLVHSLLTEPFRQKLASISAISFTIVTFHVQFSGMVQIFKFLCAYVTKIKKKLNYLVKPHERFPFGFSFIVNDLFPKKSHLQHCQHNILLKKCLSLMNSLFSQKIFTPNCSKSFSSNILWRVFAFV